MIDVGKIKAVDREVEVVEKFDPWICMHWNDFIVEETINTFDILVESIKSHMKEQGLQVSPHPDRLLPESVLDAAEIPHGFARSFLIKARRAQFRYIAPGLSVPDPQSFLQQPSSAIEENNEYGVTVQPVLLFRSSEMFDVTRDDYNTDPIFTSPFSQLYSSPAGLYLKESERQLGHAFEDSVRLVLPFGVGGNGFARTSDGLQIGEQQDSENPSFEDRHADVYQQGWNPFIEMHDVRLIKVLESWIGMVRRGDWRIRADGVEGTIEAFKESDTEQGWEKFVVPLGW